MARTRAADYDDKRKAILDQCARLWADTGYDRTSMSQLAEACGISKALLYHYYQSKDDLLFDIIDTHLRDVIAMLDEADDPLLPPEKRLRLLIGALLEAYRDSDADHKVQINSLSTLPPERQALLKGLERDLVVRFAEIIGAVSPAIGRDRRLLKPVTMSLFGMLNWVYLWFRPDGPMTREEYADLATTMTIAGIAALAEDPQRAAND